MNEEKNKLLLFMAMVFVAVVLQLQIAVLKSDVNVLTIRLEWAKESFESSGERLKNRIHELEEQQNLRGWGRK